MAAAYFLVLLELTDKSFTIFYASTLLVFRNFICVTYVNSCVLEYQRLLLLSLKSCNQKALVVLKHVYYILPNTQIKI